MIRKIGFFPIMFASFAMTVALTLPVGGRNDGSWPDHAQAAPAERSARL